LFVDLPPFSHSALPAIKSLGKASVTGRSAVIAANPTIAHLNQFARSTPELGQNLAIVLRDLDSRARAVEPDPRSPGGQGFTGLEALLGYVFNQTLAINAYGPFGHMLTVDAFFDKMCSNYASPVTVAMELQQNGAAYRHCYSWLGPNQPGINETDPSNPGGAVPDPGGAPPGYPGPKTSAAKLNVSALTSRTTSARAASPTSPTAGGSSTAAGSGTSGTAGPATSGSGAGSGTSPVPTPSLGKTIGQVLSLLGGSPSNSSPLGPSSGSSPSAAPGSQAQQLLNYLLAP